MKVCLSAAWLVLGSTLLMGQAWAEEAPAATAPTAADAPAPAADAPAPAADPAGYVQSGVFPSREQALAQGVKVLSAQRADLDHDGLGDELLLVHSGADALVVARHTEQGWRAWLVATAAPGRTPRWKPPVWAGRQVLLRYVVDVKDGQAASRFDYALDLLPLAVESPPAQVFLESTPSEHRPAARQTWRFLSLNDGSVLLETSDHRYRVLRVDHGALEASKWSPRRPAVATVSGKAAPAGQ